MSNDKILATRTVPRRPLNDDAVFIGWQPTLSGELKALYTITAREHPSLGSTVTERSLLKLSLRVPRTPPLPAKKR